MHAQPIVPSTIGQLDFFDETTRFWRDGRSVMSANPYDVTGPLLQKRAAAKRWIKGSTRATGKREGHLAKRSAFAGNIIQVDERIW